MNSHTKIFFVVGGLILAAFILLRTGQQPQNLTNSPADSNVTVVEGQQIIVVDVRGGYSPQVSTAQAGLPTILRFVTSGSYDCSSAVRIPSLGIAKNLPATGTTDIALGTLTPGTFEGTCSMGMYRFQVQVQ